MTTQFSVKGLLKGNSDEVTDRLLVDWSTAADGYEDAACLSAILHEIQQVLSQDDGLSKKVKYSIKQRGQADLDRLAKISQYRGPDSDTVSFLNQHGPPWLQDPSTFWMRPVAPSLSLLSPQAQIVGCYIQTRRDDT
jgi:hypothetical protein